MKTFLLCALGVTTIFTAGCRTVAVVSAPAPRAVSVSHHHGRSDYYRGESRVRRYPPGYRHHHHDRYDSRGPSRSSRVIVY